MRIWTLAATVLTASALQGCIIYEHCEEGEDCRWDWDDMSDDEWCDIDENENEVPDCEEEEEDPLPEYSFSLSPDTAEQGETFLSTLSVEGEYDISTIASVEMLGADVRWQELRDNGVMLLVDAPQLGAVDIVITELDGDVVVVEGALTVAEVGSGNSAHDCE